jgi:hypothetical protein
LPEPEALLPGCLSSNLHFYSFLSPEADLPGYCFSSKEPSNKGEIIRNSKRMIDKWQTELTKQEIAELKNGFCHSRLEYYRDENDWVLEKSVL